jgi:hypothetical protein
LTDRKALSESSSATRIFLSIYFILKPMVGALNFLFLIIKL